MVALLGDYIAAASPLLRGEVCPGGDLRELRRKGFILGLMADAVGLAEGVSHAVAAGRSLNGLRLARHLFEASVAARYALRVGEPAWRQLLADDAKRRLAARRFEWEEHRDALALALEETESLDLAAHADYLGSPLADWIGEQHRLHREGRLESETIASLERLSGWEWPSPPDGAAVAWRAGLQAAWIHLLAYDHLPASETVAEGGGIGAWLDEARATGGRGLLSPIQETQLVALLDAAGARRAPLTHDVDVEDWAVMEPELQARAADAGRRDREVKGRRERGERTPPEERGELPAMIDLCRLIGRPDEYAAFYRLPSWLAHPRLAAANANLSERSGRLVVGPQPSGVGTSSAGLAVASLDPMLEEAAEALGCTAEVHPLLSELRTRAVALD